MLRLLPISLGCLCANIPICIIDSIGGRCLYKLPILICFLVAGVRLIASALEVVMVLIVLEGVFAFDKEQVVLGLLHSSGMCLRCLQM